MSKIETVDVADEATEEVVSKVKEAKEEALVGTFTDLTKLSTEEFFKNALKEMLKADNDSLTLSLEVQNPDDTVSEVDFVLTLTKLK